jgi:hypothetical protein
MAIFTRFGREVRVTAYAGRHKVKGVPNPVELVQVVGDGRDAQPGEEPHWRFAHTFKADGGWSAIAAAVALAPVVTLAPWELEHALREAE